MPIKTTPICLFFVKCVCYVNCCYLGTQLRSYDALWMTRRLSSNFQTHEMSWVLLCPQAFPQLRCPSNQTMKLNKQLVFTNPSILRDVLFEGQVTRNVWERKKETSCYQLDSNWVLQVRESWINFWENLFKAFVEEVEELTLRGQSRRRRKQLKRDSC